MGRKRPPVPLERCLVLPVHPALQLPDNLSHLVVDTHTHIVTSFSTYRTAYSSPLAQLDSIEEFVRKLVLEQSVSAVVDVFCEAPMIHDWQSVVASLGALKAEGFRYSFVAGCHPSAAEQYDDELERELVAAHSHPLCVGWGEIGLDYHYASTTPEIKLIQQDVLRRQLRCSLKATIQKAITIHTREADDDIWTILTEELPRSQKLHIHCFTDSPILAAKLLDHFPNCYIGITGVISYGTNFNTSNVVRALGLTTLPPSITGTTTDTADYSTSIAATSPPSSLRIVLESDAPFMTPSNLPAAEMGLTKGQKLPLSLSAMIPWTAEFVAKVLNERHESVEVKTIESGMEQLELASTHRWTTEDVLRVTRHNAAYLYGI